MGNLKKPLAIDLFCGLGGWSEGLLAEGWDVVGFDIERHEYDDMKYRAQLVLQDVNTLHGNQFAGADLIVASPPCQAYSYRAMPFSRAKALPPPDNTLFDACFRIQREACEAAGRHIPLIVENVRGAQKWVGRARWNFGGYYLWGDVPALMPIPRQIEALKNSGGSWFRMNRGKPTTHDNPGHRYASSPHFTNPNEHIKQGGDWFSDATPGSLRSLSSKSKSRKRASALIAKIPFVLSSHIARVFYPNVDKLALNSG